MDGGKSLQNAEDLFKMTDDDTNSTNEEENQKTLKEAMEEGVIEIPGEDEEIVEPKSGSKTKTKTKAKKKKAKRKKKTKAKKEKKAKAQAPAKKSATVHSAVMEDGLENMLEHWKHIHEISGTIIHNLENFSVQMKKSPHKKRA